MGVRTACILSACMSAVVVVVVVRLRLSGLILDSAGLHGPHLVGCSCSPGQKFQHPSLHEMAFNKPSKLRECRHTLTLFVSH